MIHGGLGSTEMCEYVFVFIFLNQPFLLDFDNDKENKMKSPKAKINN